MWGASSTAAEATEAAEESEEKPVETVPEDSGDGDGDEVKGDEEDATSIDASDNSRKPPKMKTLAKTVLMFGGLALCPKVDTLQSQARMICWLKFTAGFLGIFVRRA